MNTKILVVDDEPDIRFLLKDILQDEGFDVTVAENATQADELKSSFAPNLILLDIWMPEMDGVTLLKQWSEQQQLNCPVIMMSGHGTVETAVEATRYGAYDFVEKPLSTAKLLRTVNSALSSKDNKAEVEQEDSEQPVGNSHQIQVLRQTMQTLAMDLTPVYFTGQPGSGKRIWANYLFAQQAQKVKTAAFLDDLHRYQNGLTHNIYIAEVTDLNMDRQKALLSLINHLKSVSSSGRLVVSSQYDYESLSNKSEVLPRLAEYWRQAIYIPSLNERIEDIPELVDYYVGWFSENDGLPYRRFGVAGQNMIRNHFWRDGLTELKSVIRQILSNSAADNVELAEIQQFLQLSHQSLDEGSSNVLKLSVSLDLDMREAREFFERKYLGKQLELCGYNVSELARKIGLERTNLYRKLKSLGLQTRK
jgi:DNA-binding NtrC family response regulator